MSNTHTNSDALLKQKFENFAPVPPAQIWNGIAAGIVASPSFIALYWKSIAAAVAILAIVSTGIWYYSSDNSEITEQPVISETDSLQTDDEKSDVDNKVDIIGDTGISVEAQEQNEKTELNLANESNETIQNTINNSADSKAKEITQSIKNQESDRNAGTESDKPKEVQSIKDNNVLVVSHPDDADNAEKDDNVLLVSYPYDEDNAENELNKSNNITLGEISVLTKSSIDSKDLSQYSGEEAQDIQATQSEGLMEGGIQDFVFKEQKWSIGFYFTPEVMLNNFDSVEMLTNYSFGIEPTYLINKHLFVRFGIGASYSRDRGFAKLDYTSNDLLGSYEYVYDVTFDSIEGQVVPTYHTTTAEVWDTVRHLEINTITNNYVYLQAPVLFGYYSSKSKFNWYFYGGPAINFMINKQIEEPLDDINAVDINNLQNELPERSPYYFQLWLGAGIEYKAGRNLGISLEPNYRYYFNNVFKTAPYSNSGLSGLSLRVGLVYTIQ